MSKTVFLISQYITPLEIPGGKNRYLLARQLAAKGMDVYVFSSNYNHMLKENVRDVKGLYMLEDIEGVKFVWVNTYAYQKSDWKRAINIAEFGINSYRSATALAEKGILPDVVVGSVAHAFSVAAAYYASKKLHSRFFIEVGDLWPEVFVESGKMTEKNLIYMSVKKVMFYFFDRAEKIICITNTTKNYFDSIGHGDKTIVLPFGIDVSEGILDKVHTKENDIFTIIYAGSFQPIYPLDNVVKAAKIIEDSLNSNVRFILLGNGAQKEALEKMVRELGINNVEFEEQIPKTELLRYLKQASAFLITEKHGRYGFPNKIIDYLSVGRPIIYISPARHEILEVGCCIEAQNNPQDIARAVKEIVSMPLEERREMGIKAKKYLVENHNIENITERLIEHI